jgi:DNA repair exonuclease SbcCD ATPase subunit
MEWLRAILKAAGLDDAKIDSLIGDVNKELPKHFVPKQQYNDVSEQRKQLEKDVTDRDKQLETLSKSAGDNKALQDQITQLQADNKTAKEKYEADAKELRLSTAVKLALAGKVHDPDIVAGLLDKSKIELDDNGGVKTGLDDQIRALQTSKAFLFVDKKTYKGFVPAGSKEDEGDGSTGAGANFAKAANESGKAPAAAPNPWA